MVKDWLMGVFMGLVFTGFLVLMAVAIRGERNTVTPIPFREYSVDGWRVYAFELYTLKCIATANGVSCVEMHRG